MANANMRKETDPLKCLPYEVWVECMRYVIDGEPSGPLPFVEVSQTWMRNLTRAPELWNVVYLDGGHDQVARSETFLHLSDPGPIDLVIETKHGDVLGVFKDITQRVPSRIRSFNFGDTEGITPDCIATIIKDVEALRGGGCFQNVQSVDFRSRLEDWNPIAPLVLSVCPMLEVLRGAELPIGYVSSLPKTMKSVQILIRSGETWPVIEYDGYCLQDVEIFVSPDQKWETRAPYFFPPLPLRRLSLGWGDSVAAGLGGYILNKSTHHALTKLELQISWYDIALLFPHISSWVSLYHLHLELYSNPDPPKTWTAPRVYDTDMQLIHHLTLGSMGSSPRQRVNVERVIRIFTEHRSLRMLKKMDLHLMGSNLPTPLALQLFKSLTSMETMKLNLTLQDDGTTDTATMPKLTEMETRSTTPLRYIKAPRLMHLGIPFKTIYNEPLMSLPISLRSIIITPALFWNHTQEIGQRNPIPTLWPNLRKIQWVSDRIDASPALQHLPCLEEVSFATPGRKPHHRAKPELVDNAFNLFLGELLRHPDACPRLSTIKSMFYPRWGLLLSFIHRRNQIRNATPIQAIFLPAFPQMSILKALVLCLDGSLQGISSYIFHHMDRMVQARLKSVYLFSRVCPCCIIAGYVACARLDAAKVPEREESGIYDKLPSIQELCGLPKDALLDPVEDSSNQYELMRGPGIGVAVCRRHSVTELVHVSAYTLSGLTFNEF